MTSGVTMRNTIPLQWRSPPSSAVWIKAKLLRSYFVTAVAERGLTCFMPLGITSLLQNNNINRITYPANEEALQGVVYVSKSALLN